jgi:hypothetical protein
MIFHFSIQDVRVWGQDASTISSNDGSRLGVHESWGELILTNKKDGSFKKPAVEYFSIKAGRQEIDYDDGRLLGNHDWLQQARRHDALVFKLQDKGWQADIGIAINRNDALNFNGNYYTPANVPSVLKDSRGVLVPVPANMLPLVAANGNSSKIGVPAVINPASTNRLFQMYKSLEYLYLSKTRNDTKTSFLIIADQFGKSILDSSQTSNVNNIAGYVYGLRFNTKGTHARFTTAVNLNTKMGKKKNTVMSAGLSYQFGRDLNGLLLSAQMIYFNISHIIKKHTISFGLDHLSGNPSFTSITTSHKFDPLYGSPHEYWGYMDFFYVNTGSPAAGLINPHLKWQYTSENKRFTTGLHYHLFALSEKMYDINANQLDMYLGSEFDLSWIYTLNKVSSVEGGVSAMFATHSMEYAKGIVPNSSKLNGQWIFVQFNIKPEFILK